MKPHAEDPAVPEEVKRKQGFTGGRLFRTQARKGLCRTLFAQGKLGDTGEGAPGCSVGICPTSNWVKTATQTFRSLN